SKVPGRSILAKKALPIEVEAPPDVLIELRRAERAADRSQSAQVVAGVKVIDPALCREFAIRPRTIRTLHARGVPRNSERGLDEFLAVGVPADTTQQSRAEQVGVVDPRLTSGGRIIQASLGPLRPEQLSNDVLGGAGGGLEK